MSPFLETQSMPKLLDLTVVKAPVAAVLSKVMGILHLVPYLIILLVATGAIVVGVAPATANEEGAVTETSLSQRTLNLPTFSKFLKESIETAATLGSGAKIRAAVAAAPLACMS